MAWHSPPNDMNKINPFALNPRKLGVTVDKLHDSEQNVEFEMVFRSPRGLDILNIESLIIENEQKYIYGYGENEKYVPPKQIPPVGTEVVVLTPGAVRVITTLYYCQQSRSENGQDDIYDFEEIAAMMAGSDKIASQLTLRYNLIMEHFENLGKSLSETEETSTSQPSEQ